MAAPDLTAVKAYLGPKASSFTDSQIQGALSAELAAQDAVCKVGTYEANDLVEALFRRVARNLDMRALPLGIQTNGDLGSIRIGSSDPEVRRLEAPHRRWVLA